MTAIVVILAAQAGLGCAGRAAPSVLTERDVRDDLTEALYSAVTGSGAGPVLLLNQTYPAGLPNSRSIVSGEWFEQVQGLHGDTRDSFVARNTLGNQPISRAPAGARLIDRADVVRENGALLPWPEIYRRFGERAAIWTISSPGVSADGKQAVFFSLIGCGLQCGVAEFVVLERRNGAWALSRRIQVAGL